MEGLYGQRRDAGMASLASFLIEQTSTPRACLWAHAGHIARESRGGDASLGELLAANARHRYYPAGFYVFEGSVRARDAGGEKGVVSYPIPRAPKYALEAVLMAATGSPDVAWVPLRTVPAALRTWFKAPRYMREVGAVYVEDDITAFRDVPAAFDAVVVIKSGHDSSPTPTGVRKPRKRE